MSQSRIIKPHVVVLGGGLAGISSACQLLEDGHQVTLVEKRPFLGGRTFSFEYPLPRRDDGSTHGGSPPTGAASSPESRVASLEKKGAVCQVDNGQHVYLGCCTYYIDFLQKLGTLHRTHLQQKFSIEIRRARGGGRRDKVGALSAAPLLPAPFHLFPSFLRYSHLGMKDKLKVIYGLLWVTLANRNDRKMEDQTFHHWLKKHGQSDKAIDAFWNLIILPTLNDDSRDVSAAMALMVYQEGVLKGRNTANIGYSSVGLSELMGDAARDRILALGGNILTGRHVVRLILEDKAAGKGMAGVELDDGQVVRGDAYISALPFNDLATILPTELADQPFFQGTRKLVVGPIVNVHIWYDRPVMDVTDNPFIAFLDSPLQWVFDKGRILGLDGSDGSGQYVCVSISGAWEYVDVPKARIQERIFQAMEASFPGVRGAEVLQSLVIKSPATFRCTPGSADLRPLASTPVKNFFLAGDWTDTGWPSTMEGAVRSGVAAAEAVSSRGWGG